MSVTKGWVEINLFDICTPKQWKTISVKNLTEDGYVVYGANGKIGFYSTYTHENPTVMITCRGASCGNIHISESYAYINGNAMALDNLSSYVNLKYLYYFLSYRDFDDVISGSAQPQITQEGMKVINIPLSPLNEQKRIAKKLDELLATVESIKTRLDNAPTIIKRFRQSVLAAATSGKLTEEWREVNGITDEWELSSFSILGELSRGKSKHRPRNDPQLFGGDYPFIQTGAVAQSGGLITEHSKTLSEFGLKQSRLFPENTLCITIAANIADTAFLTYPTCFPDSVVGFIADEKVCQREFIKYFIDVNKDNLETFAPATAQKNINLTILNALEIPIPTLAEQKEIVSQVESLFVLAESMEAKIEAAQKRIDKLTQSILAKAFRGELVPQDPNDEPAEKLLERIRAEQEKEKPMKTRGKKG